MKKKRLSKEQRAHRRAANSVYLRTWGTSWFSVRWWVKTWRVCHNINL